MSATLEPTTPGSLVLADLERTFGVLFVGYVASMTLYGFTFFQTYMYFLRYPNDSPPIKFTVGILCAVDTTIAGLLSHSMYYYLVTLFPFTQGLDFATDEFCAQVVLSTIAVFICQIFYAHQVYLVGKSKVVPSIIALLSTAGCALGLATSGKLISDRAFVKLGQVTVQGINSAAQGAITLAALMTFIALTFFLRPSRNAHLSAFSTWWDATVANVVSRGGGAAVVQVAYFIVFASAPSRAYWMPFHLTATKMFVVGVLTLLNSRESVEGHGMNPDESTSTGVSKPSATFVSQQGPRSNLRFNVVDSNPATINIEVSRTVQSEPRSKADLYYEDDFNPLGQHIGNKKVSHDGFAI